MTHQSDSINSHRVEFQVHFRTGRRGRKYMKKGVCPKKPTRPNEDLPRLTRLLALAHRWNRLIEEGAVANYAEVARLMGLSRARVTQIMNLLYLAPDIQEEILLYQGEGWPTPDISERPMRHITRIPSWSEQRSYRKRKRIKKRKKRKILDTTRYRLLKLTTTMKGITNRWAM